MNGSQRPHTNGSVSSPSVPASASVVAEEVASTSPSPFFVLSSSAVLNLPKYQYKGTDLSLLYRYILSPFAAFLVNNATPRWVAPNVITLTGLLLMFVSYAVMWYYVPEIEPTDEDEPPRWIFLLNAVSILFYQTLDNMDGKQARRTGSSSPLGMLFDHGCDAINSIFGSAGWMISMQLRPRSSTRDLWCCMGVLFGPYALMYIGTWEEYWTGELIMPIFNGPNEGLLGGALLSLTSFIYGPALWQQHFIWQSYLLPVLERLLPSAVVPLHSMTNAELQVLFANVLIGQEVIFKSIFVSRKFGRVAFWQLMPFFVWWGSFLVIGFADQDVLLDMPRTTMHLVATLLVEMVTTLMLDHVTHQPYHVRGRWLLLPLIFLAYAVFSGIWSAGPTTQQFLLVYTTAAMTFLTFKICLVIHELCLVLNIWCFDIVSPRQPSLPDSRRQGKDE